MSEEETIDAESSTRNKQYSEYDHLDHLLNIGYGKDSVIVKTFVREHNLDAYLPDAIKKSMRE